MELQVCQESFRKRWTKPTKLTRVLLDAEEEWRAHTPQIITWPQQLAQTLNPSHPWRSTHTLADSTSRVLLTFSLISSRGKGPLHLEPPPCQKTLPLDGPHTHRWKLNALWTFPFRAEQRRLKRTNSNHKCKKKGWKTDLYLQNTSEIKQLACGDTPVNHGLHTEDFL